MTAYVIPNDSFRTLCFYVCRESKDAKVLAAEGVRTNDAQHMAEDFTFQRKLQPDLGMAALHIPLSLSAADAEGRSPEEVSQLLEKAARLFIKELEKEKQIGPLQTQWVLVQHFDKDHPHAHLVLNRVDNRGSVIPDTFIGQYCRKACQRVEEKLGLLPAEEQGRAQAQWDKPTNRQVAAVTPREKRTANWQRARHTVANALLSLEGQACGFPELAAKLAPHNIRLKETEYKLADGTTRHGVRFELGEHQFKGGEVGKNFTAPKLMEGFAQVQVERQEQRQKQRQELQEQTREVLTRTLYASEQPLLGKPDYENRMQKQGYTFMVETGQPPRIKHEASGETFTLAEVRPGGKAAAPLSEQLREVLAQQAHTAKTLKMLEELLVAQNFTSRAAFKAQFQLQGYTIIPREMGKGPQLFHEGSGRALPVSGLKPFGRGLIEQVDEVVVKRREESLARGRIGVNDTDVYSANERLEHIRKALVAAGVAVEVLASPVPGFGRMAVLAYTHEPRGAQLDAVNEVLRQVRNSKNTHVTEQNEGYGQPVAAWREREGQFGQATVEIKGNETKSDVERAALVSAALREVGAVVREKASDQAGQVVLEILYHTHRPKPLGVTEILDTLAHHSPGIKVQETEAARTGRGGQDPPGKSLDEYKVKEITR